MEERILIDIYPCDHKFCKMCLYQAFERKFRCPMCREVPFGVSTPLIDRKGLVELRINEKNTGLHIYGRKRTNTIFCRAERNGVAWNRGMRDDHELVAINGIPCYNIEQAITRIEHFKKILDLQPLELLLREIPLPPSPSSCCWLPKTAPRYGDVVRH